MHHGIIFSMPVVCSLRSPVFDMRTLGLHLKLQNLRRHAGLQKPMSLPVTVALVMLMLTERLQQ